MMTDEETKGMRDRIRETAHAIPGVLRTLCVGNRHEKRVMCGKA